MAEFAARLTQRQLSAVRAFHSPIRKQWVPSSKTCLHRILSALDLDALDDAVSRFTESCRAPVAASPWTAEPNR